MSRFYIGVTPKQYLVKANPAARQANTPVEESTTEDVIVKGETEVVTIDTQVVEPVVKPEEAVTVTPTAAEDDVMPVTVDEQKAEEVPAAKTKKKSSRTKK